MAGNSSSPRRRTRGRTSPYTQLTDTENELRHYRKHFSGKTVLCNCDDPYESNFFKYFALNFNRLKLKKLLPPATQVRPSRGTQMSLFGGRN